MDYKEILKGIVNIINTTEKSDIGFVNICTYIDENCPELKESKDERIRKALIKSFEIHDLRALIIPGFSAKDIIAWLEKQGESTDINPSEFDLRLNKLLKQFETLSKEELTSSLSFYLNVIQNDGTYREEKQGEQKPTDKVEPKFHKGEWVVYDENIYQIHNISLKQYYECLRTDGTVHIFDFEYIDSKSHLWTIADAKDGDVLATSNYIYIFNSIDKETETVAFYCLMKKSDEHFSFGDYKIFDEILNSTPATQEQRDLLFKKMKDDGYEWDAKNKKVKEIE